MESTRPEYVGAFGLGVEIPNDPEVADLFRLVRTSGGPVRFDPESGHVLPSATAKSFGIRSMMVAAVYPKVDEPYMFGLHQCSHARVWKPLEERLFETIGQRLAEGLDMLMMFRNLRESERKLEASRSELAASRVRIVTAADETRRQIERDLHDGIQQRLVSLALKIRMAETMTPRPWGEVKGDLSLLADELVAALEALREISRGIHPAILSEGGLEPALKGLARRCPVPVAVDLQIDSRLDEALEVTAYYVVSEAFSNTVKYAEASILELGVASGDGYLALSIRDDGVGGADPSRGSGLIGLTDRVEALGGTISVVSPPGGGTALHVLLPLAPDARFSFEAALGAGVAKARSEPNAERRPVGRDNLPD
jgi:signal transduction histidine kinase